MALFGKVENEHGLSLKKKKSVHHIFIREHKKQKHPQHFSLHQQKVEAAKMSLLRIVKYMSVF